MVQDPLSKTTEVLEWPRFLGLAAAEARTTPGKARILDLAHSANWTKDAPSSRTLQQESQEMVPLLDRDALWGPLTELADPSGALDRLGRGSVLEIADLVSLRAWLYAIDSWSQTPRDEIRGELFRRALTRLMDPLEPLRGLDRILTPEGELSERASPRLAALYAEIRTLKRDIGNTLDHLIKTFQSKGVLQEAFSDVRDGRFVLPIKISSQNDVEGIVYEASASRQTVFVEPKEIAPLNNRLRQRQNDLIQEIYLILEAASKRLFPFAGEILQSTEVLTYWDSIQARSRLGRHYSGKPLKVTEERFFLIRQTAHPLLFWAMPNASIIRNEIDFGDPVRTLLLTGPNTGGKTVLLKTLGFAAICARTGFPFPGTDQPTVPFFDRIFADLGDPQSIEQHLSSFSGHVLKFKDILENVSDQSLVLIDELNSATDPEEGAALGRAFLETTMERGSMVVSTTHDPHLKAAAISDQRILNASMEFDESSRTPTYRIVLGVPGRSRAIETAERLGLPADVIARARTYLTKEHKHFEGMLARLESDTHEAEKARKQAFALREEAERAKKDWIAKTGADVGEMMERTRQKLRRILEQAQDEVRSSVRRLDEVKNRRDIDQTRAKVSDAFSLASTRLESALHEEAPQIAETLAKESVRAPEPEKAPLAVGTQVRIPKWKSTGVVLELSGQKAKVLMGKMQMSLSLHDIEPLAAAEIALLPKARPNTPRTRVTGIGDVAAPPSQLDLRGQRLDDAISQLEQYLDQAFRSGALAEVTIVHGLGTGAIREGTRKLLRTLPYIKEFRDAGSSGATLVEFDRE